MEQNTLVAFALSCALKTSPRMPPLRGTNTADTGDVRLGNDSLGL